MKEETKIRVLHIQFKGDVITHQFIYDVENNTWITEPSDEDKKRMMKIVMIEEITDREKFFDGRWHSGVLDDTSSSSLSMFRIVEHG